MREIIKVNYEHVIYDSDLDQSEKYGWSKYCDEHQPTEQEQILWGRITIAVTAILCCIAVMM